METLLAIIFIVFGVLQIILFFKIWGMTNDVRNIKEMYESEREAHYRNLNRTNPNTKNQEESDLSISKFSVGDLVVHIKTGKQMRIKNINTNNVHSNNDTYSCYSGGGVYHEGDFLASELKLFNNNTN
nr:MAG TPA: hypothetical protein [Caudoviricetes sp.]